MRSIARGSRHSCGSSAVQRCPREPTQLPQPYRHWPCQQPPTAARSHCTASAPRDQCAAATACMTMAAGIPLRLGYECGEARTGGPAARGNPCSAGLAGGGAGAVPARVPLPRAAGDGAALQPLSPLPSQTRTQSARRHRSRRRALHPLPEAPSRACAHPHALPRTPAHARARCSPRPFPSVRQRRGLPRRAHVVADQLPLAVRGTALAVPDAFRHAVRVCRLLESSHCRVLPVRAPGSQQALRCAAEYGTLARPIQAHRLRRRTRVPARVPHRVLIPARAAHHVKPPPLRPPANTCPCRRTQPLRCSVAAHDAHQRQPCLRA